MTFKFVLGALALLTAACSHTHAPAPEAFASLRGRYGEISLPEFEGFQRIIGDVSPQTNLNELSSNRFLHMAAMWVPQKKAGSLNFSTDDSYLTMIEKSQCLIGLGELDRNVFPPSRKGFEAAWTGQAFNMADWHDVEVLGFWRQDDRATIFAVQRDDWLEVGCVIRLRNRIVALSYNEIGDPAAAQTRAHLMVPQWVAQILRLNK